MKNERRFYVYVYLDPRKPGNYKYGEYEFNHEPFYVGKGCGRRWKQHVFESKNGDENNYKLNKIRKIISLKMNPIIIKYKDELDENESLKLEIDMIDVIGKYVDGEPLTNLIDGGGQPPVFTGKYNNKWIFVNKKIILNLYKNNVSISDIAKKFNVSISLIRRRLKSWGIDKRKNIKIGISQSDECKKKISNSKKGLNGELNANHKYLYEFISPNGNKYIFKNINNFCKEHDLNNGSIRKSFKRNSKYYKGWKIERILI